MKVSVISLSLLCLSTSTAYASDIYSCKDISGIWKSQDNSHSYTMKISPSSDLCGDNCISLDVSYTLDQEHKNKLICYEGKAGVSGQVPMVLAFEGKYGGHSIGSYNRELELMWTGVIPKRKDGTWVTSMDSYWFKKMTN
ncbi:hypothetical protein [Moritella sp. 28]|uniref:hypothetical protein n=1 Tax=Moritella sp. 28 TaxID=2746232 RepID=UPI001BA5C877|nr:hypothetical protein [Moritella sp. 28]QUM85151.1 hypothetical protein HWV02_11915 [Moritella sp. 28]